MKETLSIVENGKEWTAHRVVGSQAYKMPDGKICRNSGGSMTQLTEDVLVYLKALANGRKI